MLHARLHGQSMLKLRSGFVIRFAAKDTASKTSLYAVLVQTWNQEFGQVEPALPEESTCWFRCQ